MILEATRIIAVRHGETAWNVDARIQGQLDIGLNEKGRWQAHKLAMALAGEDIDAIYASDLWRAYDTALSIASAKAMTIVTDEGLRERGFGAFQGRTFADIEAALPEQALLWRKRVPDFAPEGGESLLQFRNRVLTALGAIAADHPGEQIVIATHGGVLDVLYRAATGQDLQAPRTWELGNAAINRLMWTPNENSHGQLTLVGWADSFHLDDDTRDEAST